MIFFLKNEYQLSLTFSFFNLYFQSFIKDILLTRYYTLEIVVPVLIIFSPFV